MKSIFTLICILSNLLAMSQLPLNWNVGTGGNPARNCLSTAHGPESADLLWDGSLTALRGYQTCIDGDVVVASRRFNYSNALHGAKIVAHDLHTGDTLWTAELPVVNPDNEQFSQVKGARNGMVYCTRADGIWNPSPLYALDIFTGELLWQSDAMMTTSFSEDVSFAPNGDVIIGNFNELIRVDHLNGEVLWTTNRSTPSSDGANVAVYGDRCYCWEASSSGPKVSVFKLSSGQYLYSSAAVSAGLIQQTGLFTGPDGTIYTPRTQNNPVTDFFVSYSDNGNELVKNWEIPYGYAIWASSGVGPDGTVYTYNTSGEVVGLDPVNGNVVYTSEQIINAYPSGPKMAIGADGILYVTNGEYGNEKLYSFDADLTTRWTESFSSVVIEGPSLAYDGTLVVCAGGSEMRAYSGSGGAQLFAEFTADTLIGDSPLEVHFTDLSQGVNTNITEWAWDFNSDGIVDDTDQHPEYIFIEPGDYSVTLVITDGSVTDTVFKENYITINEFTGNFSVRTEVMVYPNPFKNSIRIENAEQINHILFYTVQGQLMQSVDCNEKKILIRDLHHLPDGPVIMKVICGSEVIIRPLIKQGNN